jgi:TolA-binding protein
MKKHPTDPEPRFRDRDKSGALPEDRAGALIRGALVPAEPDAVQLARIERSLHAHGSMGGRSPRMLRLGLAALFLVVGAATVKAYELARDAGWLHHDRGAVSPPEKPNSTKPNKRSAKTAASARIPSETEVPAPAIQPLPATPEEKPGPDNAAPEGARKPPRPVRRAALAEIPGNAATATPDPWQRQQSMVPPVAAAPIAVKAPVLPASQPAAAASDEIRGLDQAIGLLRRDRNATGALAAFDSYLERYPHGILNREARVARIDALLMLQRTNAALAALETLPFDSGRRSTELQVVRGELRARTDCTGAERDFSAALSHAPDAGLLERILYGRGVCRSKQGNQAGAAEDFRRYIERFPDGTHAAWARRWLETSGKSSTTGG